MIKTTLKNKNGPMLKMWPINEEKENPFLFGQRPFLPFVLLKFEGRDDW